MKRLILIALLMAWGTVWAQDVVRDSVAASTDTIDNEENVIGAKPRPKGEKKEANVLGAPVYYDQNGNVKGSGENSEVYRRPKHHYLNNLSSRYCSLFVATTAASAATSPTCPSGGASISPPTPAGATPT